jgi:hypothetical protein
MVNVFISPNEKVKNSPIWVTAKKSIKNKFIKKNCTTRNFYMDDSHTIMIDVINKIKNLFHARSEYKLSIDILSLIVDFILL